VPAGSFQTSAVPFRYLSGQAGRWGLGDGGEVIRWQLWRHSRLRFSRMSDLLGSIAAFHSCEKAINGCPRLRPLSWRVGRTAAGCAFF